MINKRLLIKNLLAYVGENTFFDKKRQLNLHLPEGKGKFLKHVCALSNTNRFNNSYLLIGVEDEDNALVGTDFYDDSRIQHLVNAYLEPSPEVVYENVFFPDLGSNKVIGLVTISPKSQYSRFKKGIHVIEKGMVFERIGSNSVPVKRVMHAKKGVDEVVVDLERNAHNGILHTLDGVMDFFGKRQGTVKAQYLVFKEFFVLCWAGKPVEIRGKRFFSRVDVRLINEQVQLFYSHQDMVEICIDGDKFEITEYVPMRVGERNKWVAFEVLSIRFFENGSYAMDREMVFRVPKMHRAKVEMRFRKCMENIALLGNDEEKELLASKEMIHLPLDLMFCYLNGILEAKSVLETYKMLFKQNDKLYEKYKLSMRILRKLKYNQSVES